MPSCMAGKPTHPTREACFRTTQWTEVLQARDGSDAHGRTALANLCACYWYPLYAYVRRKGKQPADAEDLAQGFLSLLLEKNRLVEVHPSKGRFRTFLLTCFDNYLHDQRDRDSALKRGGGLQVLSLDWENAETRYRYEPVDERTPDSVFEKAWAFEVLARTLGRLREQCEEKGKTKQFQSLKQFLTGEAAYGDTTEAATTLDMTEGAVRVAITRLRALYRQLLREEIAQTVASDPETIEAEYHHVAEILRG